MVRLMVGGCGKVEGWWVGVVLSMGYCWMFVILKTERVMMFTPGHMLYCVHVVSVIGHY